MEELDDFNNELEGYGETPPEAPNKAPAPDDSPSGASNSGSGRSEKDMEKSCIIVASSLVVITISTSL